MRLNQFGRITVPLTTQLTELEALGFTTSGDFATIVQANYARLFPEATTPAAVTQAEAMVAVDHDQSLAEWLAKKPTQMTNAQFYAVACQLLGLRPEVADLPVAAAKMQALQLPVVSHDLLTPSDWLAALYLLLTTRTPNISTYIDDLANRGLLQPLPEQYLFFNGKILPTFSPEQLIREVVWVESDLDTDHDGQRDLLATTIFRPQATAHGIKMPALFTANPYFHGTNDAQVEAATHIPESHLMVKTASHTRQEVTYQPDPAPVLPKPAAQGTAKLATTTAQAASVYSLNDYFLPRGFVTVYSAGVGTQGSDGVRSVGGRSETASATAVIEWLAGKRRAFTDRTRTTTIDAWWCSHKIAMTGKSYLGTLAIAAATSGVAGLKTVISEAAISSWYDYYRENGLVVAPGGFQGEDADVLAIDTFSRLQQAGDMLKCQPQWEQALAAINAAQDRKTGNYNAWWDERNYRNQLAKINCDIVCVHGLNDTNVKPANVIRLWEGLRKLPISKKLFLHQGQHVYLNDIRSLDFTDMMNLWLSNKLLDVDNAADSQLPNVTMQDNVVPETWHTATDFGLTSKAATYSLQTAFEADRASFADNSTAIFTQQNDTSASFEQAIIQPTSAYAASRLWLTTDALVNALVIEGTPRLQLKLWIDAPTAILSVRLIDLGSARRLKPVADIVGRGNYQFSSSGKAVDSREFTLAAKPSACKLISYGHLNLQNPAAPYQTQLIVPGQPFTVGLDLQPTRYQLPAGHQLGLIIHGADMAQTIRPTDVVNYHLDLSASTLTLPLQG